MSPMREIEMVKRKKRSLFEETTRKPRVEKPGDWHVYFVQAGPNGPIKIGYARRVEKRIEDLQVANHEELKLVASFPCPSLSNAQATERNLHRLFQKQHIRGEWFKGTIRLSKVRELGGAA